MIEDEDNSVEYESIREEWRDDALCAQTIKSKPYMLGAWDGPNEDKVSHPYSDQAAKVCVSGCPVRDICLQRALDNPKAQGIRGGYEFDGGRLPVAKAREIRDTTNAVIGEHQSLGRPKKAAEA